MFSRLYDNQFEIDIYRHSLSFGEKQVGFAEKLRSGHYRLEEFPCPVCHGRDWLLVTKSKEGFEWSVCTACGLMQNNVRLTQAGLDEFYESGEYHDMCAHNGGISMEDQFQWNYRASSIVQLDIFRRIGDGNLAGKRVLDVGCSFGSSLLSMKDKGAIVRGFDLDPRKIEFGKKYIEEIEFGNAFDLGGDLAQYDFVTLFGVFEHLFDPRKLLDTLRERVGRETRIILTIPAIEHSNGKGEHFHDQVHIAHIWYFNAMNIERFLNSAGFEVEHIVPTGMEYVVVAKVAAGVIENQSNSLTATISAINRCNIEKNPENPTIRSNRKRDALIRGIIAKNSNGVWRLAGKFKRAVKGAISGWSA